MPDKMHEFYSGLIYHSPRSVTWSSFLVKSTRSTVSYVENQEHLYSFRHYDVAVSVNLDCLQLALPQSHAVLA